MSPSLPPSNLPGPGDAHLPSHRIKGHGIGLLNVLFVALPAVALVAGGFALHEFVVHSFSANPILNGLIVAVMVWGMVTMAMHIRNAFAEQRVFRAGMLWLHEGEAGGHQHPRLGPPAFVTGMLDRLQKLGLGHQVYIHSSAMEPEIEALEHYLEKRQELSQFLIGLMVGLGLLGTFIGLLETLIQTSNLIGSIAGGSGGDDEFTKVVAGLQKPLEGMGTAFSASMFGLVGSIVLGFQMVAVRKGVQDFVEEVRGEVLSLAEKSSGGERTEISERFLATVLADILEQHRASETALRAISDKVEALVDHVGTMNQHSGGLVERLVRQESAVHQATAAIATVGELAPAISRIAGATEEVLRHENSTRQQMDQMVAFLPDQQQLVSGVKTALQKVDALETLLGSLRTTQDGLRTEVMKQATLVKRMDTTLWNMEKDSLRDALSSAETKSP